MPEPRTPHYFEWEDAGGIAVVRFTTAFLRDERIILSTFEQLEELVATGRNRVVINFTGVEAFASYAVGKLIRLNDRLRPPDGRLVLCCLPEMLDEIIDIMSLSKRFNIVAGEREALESFV